MYLVYAPLGMTEARPAVRNPLGTTVHVPLPKGSDMPWVYASEAAAAALAASKRGGRNAAAVNGDSNGERATQMAFDFGMAASGPHEGGSPQTALVPPLGATTLAATQAGDEDEELDDLFF